jgi:hypothetical protein
LRYSFLAQISVAVVLQHEERTQLQQARDFLRLLFGLFSSRIRFPVRARAIGKNWFFSLSVVWFAAFCRWFDLCSTKQPLSSKDSFLA